jgi:arylformamidase
MASTHGEGDGVFDARTWIDISVAFDASTPPWPGDTPFSCGWAWAMSDGASVNVSKWESSPHVGTHADAPLHVLRDGAGADALPHTAFVGPARVADVRHLSGAISLAQLKDAGWKPGTVRLLLRTGQSTAGGRFPTAWPALALDTAKALVADGLQLLAVDCPSVDDRESKTLDVHRELFGGNGYVLENLDLEHVHAGEYDLIALPLKVGACDAAPVRAFLAKLP